MCGKDKEQNEKLVKEFMGKDNFIFHTLASGSPFCVILDEKPERKDKRETATICARYSQDWRDNKSNVQVHYFKGKDVYKDKKMKTGTFGVQGLSVIDVKKKWIEELLKK